MRVNRMLVRKSAVAALIALSVAAASAAAQPSASSAIATIRIDNFGKINDNYYRGAQPDGKDYADLAALGVQRSSTSLKTGDPTNRAWWSAPA